MEVPVGDPVYRHDRGLYLSNTFKTLKQFCNFFRESGTKPEIEIYDVGMINNVAFMIEAGHLQKPVYLQFVLGILGPSSPPWKT